ncbi:Hypothetical protein NGAL_HAMBI2566_60730 [Neorhizobium galegae bv. orientalis]|nr:Hypothetical protein NGAL_HAMBI2566_60730 [Neorhizobium galegae bv. orientalis]
MFAGGYGDDRFTKHAAGRSRRRIIDECMVAIGKDRRDLDQRGALGSVVDDLEYGVQHALDVLPHHLDLVAEALAWSAILAVS